MANTSVPVDRRQATDLDIDVFFPTLRRTSVKAVRATVYRAERQMESALIEMYPIGKDDGWVDELEAGLPIYLSWYARGRTGGFTGYLYSVGATDGQHLTFMCLGVGYPLHEAKGRALANASTKAAIAAICSDHRLSFNTKSKATQQLNMTQADRTDWQWLQAITARDGLSLHFRGATLLMQPFDYVLAANVKAPTDIVIPRRGFDQALSESSSPVRYFTNLGGKIIDGATTDTAAAYGTVTRMGALANTVVGAGTPEISLTQVTSPLDAQSTYTEKDITGRWTNHAKMAMDGVPSLYPLDVVRTAKEGDRAVDTAWSVVSVKHIMGDNDYVSECDLGQEITRDGSVYNPLLAPTGVVNVFNKNRTTKIDGDRSWYSIPILSPYAVTHGTTSKNRNKYRWTAEQAVTR